MAEDFKIDLSKLKKVAKEHSKEEIEKSDQIAQEQGFIPREVPKKRGRKPSPRTGQIHARVLPHISTEIADESRRRGVQQGVIIEEAWVLYQNKYLSDK